MTILASDRGAVWIMWRDNTLLALTLCVLGLSAGAGWWYTSRLLRGSPGTRVADRPSPDAYNIWKTMYPSLRRGLAFAVFLIFATIGPLSILMGGALKPVRPLQIFLVTVFSRKLSLKDDATVVCIRIL